MKIKLFYFLLGLLYSINLVNAQCTMTISPTAVYGTPGTYTIGTGLPMYIQVCSNVTLYDTLGSNQRKYYLLPGASLILKGAFSQFVYMQAGSSVTRIGSTGGGQFVYHEPSVTITGTANVTTTSCTAVSFPTISCSGSTGIKEMENNELISVYPNPANDYITINNSYENNLTASIINALGKIERVCMLQSGKNNIDLSNLNEGIYFIKILNENITVGITKVIITK